MGDYWQSRACLITGGAGFGGSHLSKQLLELGAIVHVLDVHLPANCYLKLSGAAEKVGFHEGDVRDLNRVQSVLANHDIDTVFHLAAQPLVPKSNSHPYETLSINAMGTYTVLEAIRNSDSQPRLVFASSGAYYGTTWTSEPISEEQPPLVAGNIYSPSKVAADSAVRCYSETYGIQTVCCRFINAYGPGDSNFSRIVPRAIRNLIRDESYDFGERDDGTTCLDYMHIRDMTQAYIRAAEKLPDVAGEAFNFGTGTTTSTRQLAEMISRIFDGRDREPLFAGPARDRPVIKRLDVSKAMQVLGWHASLSLEEGLAHTVNWYREFWDRL